MSNAQMISNREKLLKLNLEINQIWKVIKQNRIAGIEPTEDYMSWVNEKMQICKSLIPISK